MKKKTDNLAELMEELNATKRALIDANLKILKLEKNQVRGITVKFHIEEFTTHRLKVTLLDEHLSSPTYLKYKDAMNLTLDRRTPLLLKLEMIDP